MADMLTQLSIDFGIPIALLLFVLLWSLVWKAFAMWKSARLNQPVWFVVILIVNTLGILEILYIFLFSKINLNQKKSIKRK